MTTSDLSKRVYRNLRTLAGEQFNCEIHGDEVVFTVMWKGSSVLLVARPIDDEMSIVTGINVIGAGVTNRAAAAKFVHETNADIGFGRVDMAGDAVVFTDYILDSGTNKDALRFLLNLLGESSTWLPDLAAAAGAVSPRDAALLARDGEE